MIPVIDVRYGTAVRAVAGDRASYGPLVSPLCVGSTPSAVAAGLMALHPFPVIYLADLDGIEGRGANLGLIAGIKGDQSPQPVLWVDNGACCHGDVSALLALPGTCAVVGSETGIGPRELTALDAAFPGRVILSLDFRAEGFVGDPAVAANSACWPGIVIVMTLAHVGRGSGPDLARLAAIKQQAPNRLILAAGGIRNRADLDAAARAGASGALVSTALHAQTITAGDLIEVPAVGSSG